MNTEAYALPLLPDSTAMSRVLHAPWTVDAVTVTDSVAVAGGNTWLYTLIYAGDDGTQAHVYATESSALPILDSNTIGYPEFVGYDQAGENVPVAMRLITEPVRVQTSADGNTQLSFTQTLVLEVDDKDFKLTQIYYEYDVAPEGIITLASARPVCDDQEALAASYNIFLIDAYGDDTVPLQKALQFMVPALMPPQSPPRR